MPPRPTPSKRTRSGPFTPTLSLSRNKSLTPGKKTQTQTRAQSLRTSTSGSGSASASASAMRSPRRRALDGVGGAEEDVEGGGEGKGEGIVPQEEASNSISLSNENDTSVPPSSIEAAEAALSTNPTQNQSQSHNDSTSTPAASGTPSKGKSKAPSSASALTGKSYLKCGLWAASPKKRFTLSLPFEQTNPKSSKSPKKSTTKPPHSPSTHSIFSDSSLSTLTPSPRSTRSSTFLEQQQLKQHEQFVLKLKGGLVGGSFPPMPLFWGKGLVEDEREFVLPWDIVRDMEGLVADKVPGKYVKVKRNIYVERKPYSMDYTAICHCTSDSDCGDRCLNRVMNYLCGKSCPALPNCTNTSLALRPQKQTKVFYTGSRGFGLKAMEDIGEGEFIMDYRGEIIPLGTYYNRVRTIYDGRKDFYALDYDMDEVIDAGMKGNDARYINHSCAPNVEVRKYQTAGAGQEEYEIGFWALRDIKQGEEIFYNYNFDSFTTYARPEGHPDFQLAGIERRQRCHCGAENCSGWLGKKPGEPNAENVSAATAVVDAVKKQKAVKSARKLRQEKEKGKGKKHAAIVAAEGAAQVDSVEATPARSPVQEVEEIPPPSKRGKNKAVPALTIVPATVEDIITETDEVAPLPRTPMQQISKRVPTPGASSSKKRKAVDTPSSTNSSGKKRRAGENGKTVKAGSSKLKSPVNPLASPAISPAEKLAQLRTLASTILSEMGLPPNAVMPGGSPDATAQLGKAVCDGIQELERAIAAATSPKTSGKGKGKGKAKAVESPRQGKKKASPKSAGLSGLKPKSPRVEAGGEQAQSAGLPSSSSRGNEVTRNPIPEAVFYGNAGGRKGKGKEKAKESAEGLTKVVKPKKVTAAALSAGGKSPKASAVKAQALGSSSTLKKKHASTGQEPEPQTPESSAEKNRSNPFKSPSLSPSMIQKQLKSVSRPNSARQPTVFAIKSPKQVKKAGMLDMTDEELEALRQQFRQGPQWLVAQKEAIKQAKAAEATEAREAKKAEKSARSTVAATDKRRTRPKPAAATSNMMDDIIVLSLTVDPVFPIDLVPANKAYRHPYPFQSLCTSSSVPHLPDQDDDDEKTLVDALDYALYQADLGKLLSYAKKIGGAGSAAPRDAEGQAAGGSANGSARSDADQSQSGGNLPTGSGMLSAGLSSGTGGAGGSGGDDGDGERPPDRPGDLHDNDPAELDDEAEAEKLRKAMQAAGSLDIQGDLQAIAPDDQWYETMQSIAPPQENIEHIAAAQLNLYPTGSTHGTDDGHADRTPGLEEYAGSPYRTPGSHFAQEDDDQHDEDGIRPHYLITPGPGVEEIEWSSISDMTDLEEMEMNEREIVSNAPDMERWARSRRSRKPRAPRRFKTIITRIRPKLEAVIDLPIEEEDAALEQERKRRKKGQAWLDSMKALARARRETKARQEAGLPPPDFTLPPTSLPPGPSRKKAGKGSKEPKGEASENKEADEGQETIEPKAEGSKKKKGANKTGKSKKPRKKSGAEVDETVLEGEAEFEQIQEEDGQYMQGIEGQHVAEDLMDQQLLDQQNYEALMQAHAEATAHAEQEIVLPAGNQDNQAVAGVMEQQQAAQPEPEILHDQPTTDAQYAQGYDRPEDNPVSRLAEAASMFQDGSAHAYMQQNNTYEYGGVSVPFALQNFPGFMGSGEGEDLNAQVAQLPAVPVLSREEVLSPTTPQGSPSAMGESSSAMSARLIDKRRRGPPVKKIAGAMAMPLTDEEWENERKKRKKGFNWVQETKAAAEAERVARIAKASDLPGTPPSKKRKISSAASKVKQAVRTGQHEQSVAGGSMSGQFMQGGLAEDGLNASLAPAFNQTLSDATLVRGPELDLQPLPGSGGGLGDDIVPFPSADDDFPLPGELYAGQEQDMAQYDVQVQGHMAGDYNDVHMG